ncbi:MAG: hypothetical protein SCALA702_11810 [Melioribacteraceae bacterium]|nr:MAG: hypothetical protein SCALA702_11810 [Melioribacteraceae bacterium]
MKKFLAAFLLTVVTLSAQLVTSTPFYFTPDDSVVVTFDATLGNQGLMGFSGTVYAHTGVLLESSTAPSDWYAAPSWGNNDDRYKMTRVGTDLYELVITPSVLQYYLNAPTDKPITASDLITDLSFVFRSESQVGGGYLEAKTADGGDIFLPLYQGVNITSPTLQPYFAELNDVINIQATSAEGTDSLVLLLNENRLEGFTGTSLDYNLTVTQEEKGIVKVVAYNAQGAFSADSFYYIVNKDVVVEDYPANYKEGVNYWDDNNVSLVFTAPDKDFVYVIGDFNDWEADYNFYMKKTADGNRWWVDISGLQPGEEYAYQFLVDGELRIGDPYTHKTLDPDEDKWIEPSTYPNLKQYPLGKTEEIVSILETGRESYQWEATDYVRPAKTDLVVYELLLRDFFAEHDFATLIDTLSYLETLGVNAIELMPVNEFEGNNSWGYNPIFYFAVDKYYGPAEDLKKLVDECHKRGMAVILDMVFNHQFGKSPMVRLFNQGNYGNPTSDNPWFNTVARHPFNVGYDMNHESELTKQFVYNVMEYWIEEFNVDGYRMDLSKGFTQVNSGNDVGLWGQYDASRIAIWKDYADKLWAVDPDAYLILEHFADNSEEKELANYGMMLWGNMNHEYLEAAMGYSSNFNGTSYKSLGWNDPHRVAYMESHDEERMMFKNLEYGNSSGGYDVKNLSTALDRVKLASAFFYTIPGPKMLWQFGELGFDLSINWPSGTGNDRLTPKPPKWEYMEEENRYAVYQVISELTKLKKTYDVFRTDDFILAVGNKAKRINLNHSEMNVTVIGNFDVVNADVIPQFQSTGWWYDYFSGDSINVSNVTDVINLAPGEFHIYTDVNIPGPGQIILSTEDEEPAEVKDYKLDQNYPNPFNPSTQINVSLKEGGNVSLKIYNMLGQEVADLFSGYKNAGRYNFTWNGTDNYGNKVSSGVYLYRVVSENFNSSKKMILMK